jgi:acetolactate synthase-1/2/3 large subunit
MNGAQALIRTLVANGVDTCFMNPGTSEMHFVAALDDVPEMKGVLALFEGVATGAADGYARMAGKPAATLLHLGPGLGNGLANLHNARRAHTPVVNIVGDHATYHAPYDAPLQSDIETVARNVSGWVRSSTETIAVAQDAVDAVAAATGPPGQVATLILPADVCWTEGAEPLGASTGQAGEQLRVAGTSGVDEVAKVLGSDEPAALFVGGRAVSTERGVVAAARIAAATGCKVICETFPARLARGAGLPPLDRLGYLAEFAAMQLEGLQHLVLVDAKAPVSFFAYPEKASDLVPDGCQVHGLGVPAEDPVACLEALADAVGAPADAPRVEASRPERPTGALTAETFAQALGALMPAQAVIADEGNVAGLFCAMFTAGAPAHDWLTLTGGSIGIGMPLATGAAVAVPDRPVINLQADGSSMYTMQALWTQAREGLDVTTIILNNQSYAVLNMELDRVGAGAAAEGSKAHDMLDLTRPTIDHAKIAEGMGVPATRATTAEDFTAQLEAALAEPGPHVVEAILPQGM